MSLVGDKWTLNHLSIQFGEKHYFKLLKYDIGDNFLSIIQNMYSDVQYRVKINSLISPPIQPHNKHSETHHTDLQYLHTTSY